MSPTDFFGEKEFQPWTLAQIYADIGASGDVAEALNVLPVRVRNWISLRESNSCPLPIRRFGPTNVYSIQEWRDWYSRYLDRFPYLDGNYTKEHPRLAAEARRFFGE